jgi:hypothetical protein
MVREFFYVTEIEADRAKTRVMEMQRWLRLLMNLRQAEASTKKRTKRQKKARREDRKTKSYLMPETRRVVRNRRRASLRGIKSERQWQQYQMKVSLRIQRREGWELTKLLGKTSQFSI